MSKSKPPKSVPDIRQMFQLAERYSEASELLVEHARGEKWGSTAPKLHVESFAVELYLKCLCVQDTSNAPPDEHDWKKLFYSLKEFSRDAIRDEFKRSIKSHPVLSNLGVINPDAVKVTDFDRALEVGKNTFHKRRYLYEPPPPTGEWFYAHLLKDAIRKVVIMDVRLAGLTDPEANPES
jgi:hypothetical protein